MRSLVAHGTADWPLLQPVLTGLLARPGQSISLRAYTSGIVAWGVLQGRWGAHQADAVDLVCRQFDQTRDPGLALQLMLTLKQLMAHAVADAADPLRQRMRQRIAQTVRRAAADAPAPEIEQQLRQLRATFPGEF